MGVSQEAMDAVEVRRDLMHHVSSTFDHVFVGKTAACASDLTESKHNWQLCVDGIQRL